MISLLRSLVLLACALAFAGPAVAQTPDTVILISIDGFRPDYLDRGQTPTLSRLAADGVRASMRPSFPSVTFPNHYTLVTGLRPDRNGMVNNRMEDPARPGAVFTLNDRTQGADPFWWDEATPIWVTAERQGVRTGTMYWPGSDVLIHDTRPTKWRSFDQTLPSFARVDALLSWLDAPAAERPRFLTLYFDIVDSMGHRYGPDSMETTAAASEVDAAMARLIAGLDQRHLLSQVDFVIVADHGMTAMPEGEIIDLDAAAPAQAAHVVWDGPFAGLTPVAGHEADVEHALLGRGAHGECWRKGALPPRFHFGANSRVPAIVCLADLGWRYHSSQLPSYGGQSLGNHGYDPAAPDMAAIFIANGPAFRHGVTLPSFDNVSVYPLLARLIGVNPEPNDGNPADTAAALAH
ncbi:MAG TPA: ectonucleotide pyrophosphatase/phosphodiesterase [Caulobacterales bacterium]|nr:ectonucleotide pyrophosphatase/phosphodiesterase [Caulobacterales bacterium]